VDAFREANDGLRARAQQFGFRSDDTLFFFCECDDPRCTRLVAVVLGAYDKTTRDGRRILSRDHDDSRGR
jgi:hypothetical protein